jgi:hypothetical protein
MRNRAESIEKQAEQIQTVPSLTVAGREQSQIKRWLAAFIVMRFSQQMNLLLKEKTPHSVEARLRAKRL